MKFGYLLAAPALFVSISASAAEPVVQTPEMDMRCYLTIYGHQKTLTDPVEQNQAMFISMFFVARLSAQLPVSELKPLAIKESVALKMEQPSGLLTQCALFVREQLNTLKSFGEDLRNIKPAEIQKALEQHMTEKSKTTAEAKDDAEAQDAAEVEN